MSNASHPKRLIEVDLPIKRISAHARREKSIRHGHISTLHIWWARRPLAACRAVICAALWPDPADPLCPSAFREAAAREMAAFAKAAVSDKDVEPICDNEAWKRYGALAREKRPLDLKTVPQIGADGKRKPKEPTDLERLRGLLLDFIADFAAWEASTSKVFLATARALTQAAHEALGGAPGTRPLVVDPFAGGGAIPLEALRVGADAFASDLNPVAVLLNKVVLEYIPKYGQKLADEVRKWGQWIKEEAEKELAEFYPKDPDGATPIAYLWARTIKCEGPGCGAEVPLVRSLTLATRGRRATKFKILPRRKEKRIEFTVEENAPGAVEEGTVRRGSATCPICGYTTPAKNVRAQFVRRAGGTADARLLAVVTAMPGVTGKRYRLPNERDIRSFARACSSLSRVSRDHRDQKLSLVPNEELPYLRSIFNINLLGVTEWGQLHTPRQALALASLARLIRDARRKIGDADSGDGLGAAVQVCLGLALDRSADRMTSLCRWIPQTEAVGYTFGRQALGIIWDYVEINPLGTDASWIGAVESMCEVIQSETIAGSHSGQAEQASATTHSLPDDSADAVVTDPPYYDAVPYADLSDFFYVWLRRTIAPIMPSLFVEPLSPKTDEVVQLAERNPKYAYKTRERFEKLMVSAMSESRRILRPSGVSVVVFAHKTTVGWETQLKAMVDAGWTVTGSWPIDTERPGRLRAIEAAALASSVHLVCRPRENPDGFVRTAEVGDWRDVLAELPKRIHEWLPRLAEEGVVGADAIFACLGPALEVFSRYSRVEKANGEQVALREYLEQVWAAVAKEALAMIFSGADASGFEEDSRLTAMWLWTLKAGNGAAEGEAGEDEESEDEDEGSGGKKSKGGGYSLEYDAARKIAQGLGAHLEKLASVVEVKGDTARLLPVSERTRHLFGRDDAQAPKSGKKKAKNQMALGFMAEVEAAEAEAGGWGTKNAPKAGDTVLDRLHQAMILFAAGRSEALRRFLVEDGHGRDQRFWRLAQALSALYPANTDEKRWTDGVLARKKGLGF